MKTTLATIKRFIRENKDSLYINVKSSFDGMVDCVMPLDGGFRKAEAEKDHNNHTLGISGAWFVLSSRDYFYDYHENGYKGYKVSNCCGSFILAIKEK